MMGFWELGSSVHCITLIVNGQVSGAQGFLVYEVVLKLA
jgi:hypothetical protein